MKPDICTKAVITIIAIMLTVIACKPLVTPETSVSAQGPFAGVQLSFQGDDFTAFDTRTGDIWYYRYIDASTAPAYAGYDVHHMGKLGRVGDLPTGVPRTIELGEKDQKK